MTGLYYTGILHTEGLIGEQRNMLNAVHFIVRQSIACVNNASPSPSHYALLMIHSCPFVNLHKLQQRQCIDLHFQLILIKLLIILMWVQPGCLSQELRVYHASNKQK